MAVSNDGKFINSFPTSTKPITSLKNINIITLIFDLRNNADTLQIYLDNKKVKYSFRNISLGGQIPIYFGLSIYDTKT